MSELIIKRPGLRKSINAMCKWCIYDPLSGNGTWRQQVDQCAATDCPLYLVRPRATGAKIQSCKHEWELADEESGANVCRKCDRVLY